MADDPIVQEIIEALPHLSNEELRELLQQVEYRRGYLAGVRASTDEFIENLKKENRQRGIPDTMLDYDILGEMMYQEGIKKPMPPYKPKT